MQRRHGVLRSVVLVTVAALAAGACSGSDGASSATVTAPDTLVLTTMPQSASTTVPDSTTTSTTVAPVIPTYPLTGLPVTDPLTAPHAALVVKIDNHSKARPQTGLGVADIVFEENVEGITRFAAVFQSTGSDPVGPIRSGRTQDVAMLGSFDHPLFAWSGGNPSVTKAINNSDFVNISNLNLSVQKAGGFFRANDRSNPHDLYAETTKLWTLTPVFAPAPPPQFVYRQAGDVAGDVAVGDPSLGVTLEMDGVRVEWRYDSATGEYARFQNGDPHLDAATGAITAANVVVPIVRYQPSPADVRSPEAQTIGSGDLLVFTGGVLVRGTWERATRLDPFLLRDSTGATIELTPGRTWVELARDGAATPTAG